MATVGTFPEKLYHYPMRHIVLALMIVLLPLRGWVSDAMATEMASGGTSHVQMGANAMANHSHPPMVIETAPDCAGHSAGAGAAETDARCATCAACQVCHTVALPYATTPSSAVSARPALSCPPAVKFASALVALGQKPPIS